MTVERRIDRDRFPRLSAFLAGYLHEDFALDHKTPSGALRAFLADAREDERDGLRAEWRAFMAAVEDLGWRDVRAAFTSLGGVWRPASRAALLSVFDELLHGPRTGAR